MNRDVINEHYYGDPADPSTERARERIHWICSQAAGQDVLDVGCSQGIVSLILGREGYRCIGIDIESASLAVGEQTLAKEDELVRRRVTLKLADATELPFSNESFDTVILGEILEHLVHPSKVLTEARRVLRQGGRVVVTVPYGLNAFPDHKRTYYPISLLELLQPLFKTSSIGTLGNYITYTGTKEVGYNPAALTKEALFEQYLPLEKALEARCLSKELQLLETATKLYAQVRTLTTQSDEKEKRLLDLEQNLQAKSEQARDSIANLEQSRKLADEQRERAIRACAELDAQTARIQDLQAALAAKETHTRELELSVEQKWGSLTELSKRAAKAEATTVAHANNIRELHKDRAAQQERMRQLGKQFEREQASATALQQRVVQAEAALVAQTRNSEQIQQTIFAKEKQIQALETQIEHERVSARAATEQFQKAETASLERKARIEALQESLASREHQIETLEKTAAEQRKESVALHDQLLKEQSSLAKLSSDLAKANGQLTALEQKVAALQSEKTELQREIAAKSAEGQQKLARMEALHSARLQERDKQHAAELAKREADWKRKQANQRVRDSVRFALPAQARVLVISKGDDDLLNLDGRRGLHFPQAASGVYAGYHPADSAQAIAHLQALKELGAEFLLIPASAFWWLDFYKDFRRHLEDHYRLVVYNDDCIIFSLTAPPQPGRAPGLSLRQGTVSVAKAETETRSNGHGSSSTNIAVAPAQATPPAPAITPERSSTTAVENRPAGGAAAAVLEIPAGRQTLVSATDSNAARASSVVVAPTDFCKTRAKEKLTIGCVFDEFTAACFRPECNLVTFRPDNWKAELEANSIDLLFIESAWQGNGGSWQYKVASFQRSMGEELVDLVKYCNSRNIPTVFWNKEDPPHFNRFIHRAPLFDFVFTSDADMIPKYCAALKHSRVAALPFAAQPEVHNPIVESDRLDNVCFAGAYYAADHDERRADMEHILRPALAFGLHIYDRQHGVVGANAQAYRFPDIYQGAIKGRLEYHEMIKAYKRYKVFLNVNSVKRSPTMFSRRVFELLASGTPVISSFSVGIEQMLGNDIVHLASSEQETLKHLERLLHDDSYWARVALKGVRAVCCSHTYARRLAEVCERVGLSSGGQQLLAVEAVALVKSEEQLRRLTATLARQKYRNFALTLTVANAVSHKSVQVLKQALPDIDVRVLRSEGEIFGHLTQTAGDKYLWLLNLEDYYGENFLHDATLTALYADAELIGKGTHYQLTSGALELSPAGAGNDFRFVSSVAPGSLMARAGMLSSDQWRALAANRTPDLAQKRVLSIDRFNYVARAGAVDEAHINGSGHPLSAALV